MNEQLTLPDTVASAQDLSALIVDLHSYYTWLTHESVKQRVVSAPLTPAPQLGPAASSMLRSLRADQRTAPHAVNELIEHLDQYAVTAPRITLTLAGIAPNPLRQELVAWCRANLDPRILVHFQVNSTLLGGMVVRYGSRVFDWSFRRQIIAQSRSFPEILRRV